MTRRAVDPNAHNVRVATACYRTATLTSDPVVSAIWRAFADTLVDHPRMTAADVIDHVLDQVGVTG